MKYDILDDSAVRNKFTKLKSNFGGCRIEVITEQTGTRVYVHMCVCAQK